MAQTIAVLGAGKMGEALLSGMLGAGLDPVNAIVTARRVERREELVVRYGVRSMSNAESVEHADLIILAVKPQDMEALLAEIGPVVAPSQLVITIAAGITTGFVERALAPEVPVVRVMSNTAVLVDEAMSVLSGGQAVDAAHLAEAARLFETVGKVAVVPESQQDAVTALSGSGPAYFFFLVEAMIDAGILLGLPRAVASDLIIQTAIGAAKMLRETGEHPVALREAVTSPAGTTINAIRELENHKVRAAFLDAMEAARDRSRDLGR